MTSIRSGAALIIVLLILTALMVLGLPFLYSQSASLAGTRSLQAAQSARIYRQAAEQLGAAIAGYTVSGAWKETGLVTDLKAQIHTALGLYLSDADSPLRFASSIYAPDAAGISVRLQNTVFVDPERLPANATVTPPVTTAFNQPDTRVRIGLEISDESGRLDANTLSAQVWQDLFALDEVEIPDWDDQQVMKDGQLSAGGDWPLYYGPDANKTGELADALVDLRLRQGRFTRLEQLLNADPQTYRGDFKKFRKRLSRGELERLRPYLSFHNPQPGRAGFVDLGSVIYTDVIPPPIASTEAPRFFTDVPGGDGLAIGQWAMTEETPGGKTVDAMVGIQRIRGALTPSFRLNSAQKPTRDSSIVLQTSPSLNIHQLSPILMKLGAYKHARNPSDPGLVSPESMLTFYGAQIAPPGSGNALPTGFLSPWYMLTGNSFSQARQPVDLRSSGMARISAASTVRDRQGALLAQESRTILMQVVPQEGVLESRWTTQGQFEPLLAQRFGSQMQTWPNATNRMQDVVPDDQDPATATTTSIPTAETGIAYSTQRSIATYGNQTHLPVTWRATFGAHEDSARSSLEVLKDEDPIGTYRSQPVSDLNPPPANQTHPEHLYPDGLRVGKEHAVGYEVTQDKGPLVWTSPTDSTIAPRHLSFWFKPESDWWQNGNGPVVTLLEARPLDAYKTEISPDFATDSVARNVPGETTAQNYLGLHYDPKQNMLVLGYSPPSACPTAPVLPWLAESDLPSTSDVDERCLPSLLLPLFSDRLDATKARDWSKTFTRNRVMTCYKLGWRFEAGGGGRRLLNIPEIGRWYHVQIVIGNGRPGGLGLILDSISGTDVGLMSATDYVASRQASGSDGHSLKGPWPGDHLTFPSLILADARDVICKEVNKSSPSELFVDQISIELPGFASFDTDDYTTTPSPVLTPTDVLPARGTALIGDEYVRYESIVSTGSTGTLQFCWRGARQKTNSGSSDPLDKTPTTQKHRVNDRILADGFRFRPNGTVKKLYLGGELLLDDFGVGDLSLSPNDQRYGAIMGQVVSPGAGNFSIPGIVQVVAGSSIASATAPDKGYVRWESLSNARGGFYRFTRSGTSFSLSTIDTTATKIPTFTDVNGSLSSPNPISIPSSTTRLVLISLAISDAQNPLDSDAFVAGLGVLDETRNDRRTWALAQLLNTGDGRCEWIHYSDIIRDSDGVYLLNRLGFGFGVPDASLPATEPWPRQRACERTPPPARPGDTTGYLFPKTTTRLLPVQPSTAFGSNARFLSPGDVITLVPNSYAAARPSVVLGVRYAANDGYATAGTLLDDTYNERFSFTYPLRGLIGSDVGAYQVIMGSGLNTLRDLSPLGNLAAPEFMSALPRLDAHTNGTTTPSRVTFGSADTARSGIANQEPMTIDALAAGTWTQRSARLRGVINDSGVGLNSIPASGGLPLYIWVSEDVFSRDEPLSLIEIGGEAFVAQRLIATTDDTKLIAGLTTLDTNIANLANYVDNNRDKRFAKLVARGLLNSTSMVHQVVPTVAASDLTVAQINSQQDTAYGAEVMRLPVGPVRLLTDAQRLEPGNTTLPLTYELTDGTNPSDTFPAPAALICEPSRLDPQPWLAKNEVILPGLYDSAEKLSVWNSATSSDTEWDNPNWKKWLIARWYRGLYNSNPTQEWKNDAITNLNPVVIGYWPRYPSALPKETVTQQHRRSRVYPWVGFPLNLHNLRVSDDFPALLNFDGTLPANKVLVENNPNLVVDLRAMAGAVDGDQNADGAIRSGSGLSDWTNPTIRSGTIGLTNIQSWQPISGLFTTFGTTVRDAKELDGVEVRLSFRYTGDTSNDLSDIARAANRSPLISGFKLRGHAPMATIAVEDAR